MDGKQACIRAALICQDVELKERLAVWLPQLWPQLCICAEAKTGQEGLDMIEVCQPHLVFCEMPLPDLCGMEIGLGLEGTCYPIFLLDPEQVPQDKLNQIAVDYLLKPVDREDLKRKVDDLKRRLATVAPELTEKPSEMEAVRVISRDRIRMVPVEEILAVEATDSGSLVYTENDVAATNQHFRDLMAALDPQLFRPVQRQVLVRTEAMDRLERHEPSGFVLRLKGVEKAFEVSPSFSGVFRRS